MLVHLMLNPGRWPQHFVKVTYICFVEQSDDVEKVVDGQGNEAASLFGSRSANGNARSRGIRW